LRAAIVAGIGHYGSTQPSALPGQAALSNDTADFKNFHRSLCDRFGYTHDEKDWRRDLVSLEEHIAKKIEVPSIVLEVLDELRRAIAKFPTWPTDPLHAIGVLNEEVGELNKAVLQQVYEPHKNKPGEVSIEARQAAAMTLRFLASLENYDWRRGHQHQQSNLGAL
jgi:hypothetical protein